MGVKHVVKVQRPLAQSGGEPIWLVYAEGHNNVKQLVKSEIPAEVIKLMGHRDKMYINAYLRSNGWQLLAEEVKGVYW